jgi:hypothetical protein
MANYEGEDHPLRDRDASGDSGELDDSVLGAFMGGGSSGPVAIGINSDVLSDADTVEDVEGDPLNADYSPERTTPVPGDETDTAEGFAGEGGANPDADLPPRLR